MYHKLKMCQYISKLGLKFVRTIPNESTSSHHAGWSMVWLGPFGPACTAELGPLQLALVLVEI